MIHIRLQSWFKKNAISFFSLSTAIIVLLFGSGLFNAPKIRISCGAIDLGLPAKQLMEIASIRFFLSTDKLKIQLNNELQHTLREYGLKEDRIASIIKDNNNGKGQSELRLTPREETIMRAVLGKLMVSMTDHMQKDFTIPGVALFFQIENSGRVCAKNPHIIIHVKGCIYNYSIESDNKVLNTKQEDDTLSIDLSGITPGSKTRGIVWLVSDKTDVTPEQNQVTVCYDNATVRQSFQVDEFYLKK